MASLGQSPQTPSQRPVPSQRQGHLGTAWPPSTQGKCHRLPSQALIAELGQRPHHRFLQQAWYHTLWFSGLIFLFALHERSGYQGDVEL